MSRTGLTRRDWTAALVAVPLVAQVASAPQKPTPDTPASSAVDDVRQVSNQLAQIEVPISIEPAFTFHV